MPATTTYGVDLVAELGVGRQANVGVWDTGVWNASVWGQPDTDLGDWVDVTCQVAGTFTLTAGTSDREGVVTRWEAATCTFTLDGTEWDPWNGPYVGVLGPQLECRWRWRPTGEATWRPLFYGAVTDGGWDWDPLTGQAKVVCADLMGDLTAFDGVAQTPVGAGDTASGRVTRVLDYARWPAARRDVTAGGVALVATDLDGTAWSELLNVADSDLGLLWVKRDGSLAYRPQGRVGAGVALTGALTACPLPGHPEAVQVIDMGRSEPTPVANIASVRAGTPPGGTDPPYVTVTDEGSVSRFRARHTSYDSKHDGTARPDWSGTIASLIVASQAWPSMAPRDLTLGLASGDDRVPSVLFSLELDQSFTLYDTGARAWTMEVAGWDVTAGYDTCGGHLYVSDIARWVGDQWDSAAGWDTARWGLGKVS